MRRTLGRTRSTVRRAICICVHVHTSNRRISQVDAVEILSIQGQGTHIHTHTDHVSIYLDRCHLLRRYRTHGGTSRSVDCPRAKFRWTVGRLSWQIDLERCLVFLYFYYSFLAQAGNLCVLLIRQRDE